jgi:hypothetical protein
VGIFDFFSKQQAIRDFKSSGAMAIESPWAELSGIYSVTGSTGMPAGILPTVAAASHVPAVSRGNALYSVVAAGSPLRAVDPGAAELLPGWINKTWGPITPGKRRAQLVQDMFFHNESMMRLARDASGAIVDAMVLNWDRWQYATGADGKPVVQYKAPDGSWFVPDRQDDFLWIPGLLPISFLEFAAESIAQYAGICQTISQRSKSPIPLVELHITEEYEGTVDQLKEVQAQWVIAREAENGAVGITPRGVQLIKHLGGEDAAMLIQARNAIRVDFANFVNLNASMLDGASGTTDTYSNTLQDANEFLRLSLGIFTLPISQRLSQDDVTPEGLELEWDFSRFDMTPAAGNTGSAVPAQAIGN